MRGLFIAHLGTAIEATISTEATGMTAIGTVKPDRVASPHGGDLPMTVRILPIR
jgi:hypothetical protein